VLSNTKGDQNKYWFETKKLFSRMTFQNFSVVTSTPYQLNLNLYIFQI